MNLILINVIKTLDNKELMYICIFYYTNLIIRERNEGLNVIKREKRL